jgi:prepilin-type processing-associated H-X9-DG protein
MVLEAGVRRPKARLGFTLVEATLTVAVLVLLAGLFYSIFCRLHENGLRTSCQDNLRKLSLAVSLYLEDQDTGYPSGPRWDIVLAPYAKQKEIFLCPAATVRTASTDYWINPNLNQLSLNKPNVKNRADPSMTFLNGDFSDNAQKIETACGPKTYYIRHLGGANYSFVDGHAKWMKPNSAAGTECPGP